MAEITAKMAMRTNTLYMYKNLLKVARALPEPKREQSLRTIRADFKSGALEMDSDRVEEMLKKAASTLGYLKIVTPKPMKGQTSTHIVFGTVNGKTKSTRATTNWTGSNMDPDSVARHHHLLKRGGFKSNADAKGIF